MLKAITLVSTLKPSPDDSSSDKIAEDITKELKKYDTDNTIIRVVDYDIKPGVEPDMGAGDAWPSIRAQILAADILIMTTPTWVGHMTSEAQRVLERLDAEISQEGLDGLPTMFGKVAAVAVVGNEDGAHKISGDLFQALNDIGFTLPAQAATYWNDEAMGSRDYIDLKNVPEKTAETTAALAKNVTHLAKLLKDNTYPS